MSKLTNYLYLFSKITTSVVLLFIIIIMGYLLKKSYLDIDTSSIKLNENFLKLNKALDQNSDNISKIDEKIIIYEKNLEEIKAILGGGDNKVETKKNIKELFEIIKILQTEISNISSDLNKTNDDVSKKNILSDQLNSLMLLIYKKYENGEGVENEINLLESMVPKNKNLIFEKISIIKLNKFYGFNYLDQVFDESLDVYIKKIFLEKNYNSIMRFIYKFVEIKPANLSVYEDNTLNILIDARNLLKLRKIKESLNLVLLIEKNEIYFEKWILQVNNYLEFKLNLNKVIEID